MTLKELEGFDLSVLPTGWIEGYGTNIASTTSFDTGRDGVGKSLWFNTTTTTVHPCKVIPSTAALGFGFAFKTSAPLVSGSTWYPLFMLAEGPNTTWHLSLCINTAGQLALLRGNHTSTTVLAGPTAETYDLSQWTHIAAEVSIADAGGICKVYMNGSPTPVIDFAGDTRNTGAAGVIDRIHLAGNGSAGTGQPPASALRYDDFYWFTRDGSGVSAVLGDCTVRTLQPDGNGATSAWAGSDGNSVDNYALVDDAQVTTDYVSSSTPGQRDLYSLANPSGTLGAIKAVQTSVYASKSDAGTAPGPLLAVYRDAAGNVVTDQAASVAQLGTGWAWFNSPPRSTAPDGTSWDTADLNALQAGVEVG